MVKCLVGEARGPPPPDRSQCENGRGKHHAVDAVLPSGHNRAPVGTMTRGKLIPITA